MNKCPNCGQATVRTEDWACQWCGYPLLSESYKKIPKTYKQLKEEELHERKPPVAEETEARVETEPERIPEAAPTLEAKPELVAESEPEPAQEPEPATVPKAEIKPTVQPETEPPPKPELGPMTAAIELTVEELLSAYDTDEAAADKKFANMIIRLTGVVAMIDVKEKLDTHYIRLTDVKQRPLQNVRCIFEKKYGPELSQLTIGQTVTVQGKYHGSIMDIRMVGCVLIR
ncbi:hypothetical protein ACFLYG_02605 [Chloroflexota bacterium]